jgi:gamma-glutamyltranspeptidase/glutathione hydrolase
MYLDKDGNVVKGLSTNGHLAVGVPGTVSGMEMAREKYGTMKRAALLAPAVRYAQDGFTLDQGDIDMFATATDDFRKDPVSAAIFLNNGEPFQVGQKIVQKDLAQTAEASSRRPTSTSTRPASSSRSSATTAATVSSRRRRRARAAS